jgi:predicted HD phosphohydrolase/predicted nucleotidyltransferase
MSKPDYRKSKANKLRRTIALEAAKLMYEDIEREYFTAKRKAARKMGVDYRYHPSDLPSNKEIREEILKTADLYEGEKRYKKLQDMRLYALSLMRELSAFSPRLIGSTLTGHIHKNSDIDLHIFSDSLALVTQVLDNNRVLYDVERKRVVKYGEERQFTHIHVHARYEVELTLYTKDLIAYHFKSSITGKPIERASIKELESLIRLEHQISDLEEELHKYNDDVECYEMFKLLLLPLEDVKGSPYHPEGDMLYHSLQVFELAKQWHGYDLEFLQAALLHDVGKAIDSAYHAEAGADALEGFASERVIFLVRHHMDVLKLKDGSLGHKKTVELRHSEYWEDLLALRELDDKGRERGILVDTLEEALAYLKNLENEAEG